MRGCLYSFAFFCALLHFKGQLILLSAAYKRVIILVLLLFEVMYADDTLVGALCYQFANTLVVQRLTFLLIERSLPFHSHILQLIRGR